jgi:hypothetical protein
MANIEMQYLRSKQFPKYLTPPDPNAIGLGGVESLMDKAFSKLSTKNKLEYLKEVKRGYRPDITQPKFMTEKEFHTQRLQKRRDSMPEIYKNAPQLTGTGFNPWIAHVKKYQADHKCTYKEALQRSKHTYK